MEIRSRLSCVVNAAYVVPGYTACYYIQVVSGAKFNTRLLKNSLTITGTHNHVKTDLNVSDGKGRSIQTLEFERRKHPI